MNDISYSEIPPGILMVDDTPANLELLSGMLKGQGYRVRAAVSGKLALQAARNDPPDLILLDINMPEMDGFEVCAKLKSEDRLKDIPVIFLSALSETIDKVKAFGIGGVDYITKPFQFEEVEARVKTHLQLHQQRQQLRENYSELRELKNMRDSLVDMIISDLRLPLTSICGDLELIEIKAETPLSPDSALYLAKAVRTARQIVEMVSDVLDPGKLEAGKLGLKLAECDLRRVLEDSVRIMKPLLENRSVLFTPYDSPAMALADREIISRTIQNLLANAAKFTTRNNGIIMLSIEPAGDRARVSVRDNGPGIAPEQRQNIFKKFGRVELRAGHQENSASLGLSFCKMAVEAHGGLIGVDSEEGKGSTFWFELPLNGPGPHDAAAPKPAENY